MVRSFATREAAGAWVVEHQRKVAGEPIRLRYKFPKPSKE